MILGFHTFISLMADWFADKDYYPQRENTVKISLDGLTGPQTAFLLGRSIGRAEGYEEKALEISINSQPEIDPVTEALDTISEMKALADSQRDYLREDSHPAMIEVAHQRAARWARTYETVLRLAVTRAEAVQIQEDD
jgi:hypothetical protein